MELIEECFENWADQEIFWIQYYKNKGCKLTNLSDGGEGINIKVRNKEWYRKVVETRKRNGTSTPTKEVVDKIRSTNLKRTSLFCRNGHKRTIENTGVKYKDGRPYRSCLDCIKEGQLKDNKYSNNNDRRLSQKENYKVLKKWHDENGFQTKEFCKRGHPLSGDNLRLLDRAINGKHKTERICRQCVRQRNQESKRRKRNGLKNSGV